MVGKTFPTPPFLEVALELDAIFQISNEHKAVGCAFLPTLSAGPAGHPISVARLIKVGNSILSVETQEENGSERRKMGKKREKNGMLAGQELLYPWHLSHLGTECSVLNKPIAESETARPDPRNAVAHL